MKKWHNTHLSLTQDLYTHVIDYGKDYPQGKARHYGKVSYAELKSGTIEVEGKSIPSVPLSSLVRAREIAELLKKRISAGKILVGRAAVYAALSIKD